MFDEWYAQPSYSDTVAPGTPQRQRQRTNSVRNRTESIARERLAQQSEKKAQKPSIPVFEKPVIIRPKSTTDLWKLNRGTKDILSAKDAPITYRFEQDLETKHEQQTLEDERQFELWADEIQTELEDATLERYTTYRAALQARLHSCNTILSHTSELLSTLSRLKSGFTAVAEQTSSFQAQCNNLVEEEERLSHYADKLAENIHPFESLEPVSRQLNAPGAEFVTKPDFTNSLKRVDQGLVYFQQNSDFKDAELYEMRFRQCMTRALTLVRVYFVNSLKAISNDINQRISGRQMNETTQSALLYAKFRSSAPPLKNVVGEIELRSRDNEEYAALLNECYQAYFGVRLRLVTPIIMARMAEISGTKDIVVYCRSAFTFLRNVCTDEYDLFYQFFPTGEKELYQYLANLSEPLYDHVRPRIIHETQIIALSELCLLFQTQFMRDPDEAEDSYFNIPQLDFGNLIQPALQDAQSRLVFRTENLIINEIQNFTPKDADLDYPKLLHESGKVDPTSPKSSDKDVTPTLSGEYFDSDVLFQGWYPTLRKSIWILSKIYRLSAVFDDLAHQVVHLCIQSLFTASTLLTTKKSRLDSDLFLIKHLLILKEQIGAFDIEYVRSETGIDIPSLVERFREFSIFSPAALTKVVQLPVVVENMLDAKEELDGKLRIAINGFTKASAEGIYLCVVGKGAVEVSDDEIKEASEKFRENAEKLLPTIQQKTEEYIGDPRTIDILVNAVMENALIEYEKYFVEVEGNHGKLAGDIWDVHTIATWLNGLILPKDIERDSEDGEDVESNAGSEGRLERDFDDSP